MDILPRLGFSEYEARAYVALVEHGALTGYELAKVSGVPRPNIYGVLGKLAERGAVLRTETAKGTRYAPVPPQELMRRLQAQYDGLLASAQQALEQVGQAAQPEYATNAEGYAAVLEHARGLLDGAREEALLAVWPEEARALAAETARAEERDVKVTTLCLAACPQECGNCRGDVFRYSVSPEQETRWLVLVTDASETLAGEIAGQQDALAVRTRQRLLAELAAWYIRQSIALATVVNDLGDRLDAMLSPAARQALTNAGTDGADWLGYMRGLLARGEGAREP